MGEARESRSATEEDLRIAGGLEQLRSLLVPGESLEAYAVQRRIFALTHRRTIVGVTSGRLIGMSRGLFGGFHPVDVRWQDLKDIRIQVGIFGAELAIILFDRPDLAIAGQTGALRFNGLRKSEAQRVYRICQAQEQGWREKRRVREIEELRARSGGIQLSPSGQLGSGATAGGSADSSDPVARLGKAKEMLDKGLISDAEYESLKARLISGL